MHAVLEMWNGATTDDLPTLLAPTYRGHMLGAPDGERDAAAYPATVARRFPMSSFASSSSSMRAIAWSRGSGPAARRLATALP